MTIVTGFLGSGKTTLLNHILTNQKGLKTAVVVNEFGAIGIDGALIVSAVDDMVELSNGCICCTTNGDLMDAVFRILERGDRVDYLIVETTGLADPLPVALTFLGPAFRHAMRLDSILTVVDAENFDRNLSCSRAARDQLIHADIVLLNKCDLVSPQRLRDVEAQLRQLKDGARILRTTRADVPLAMILSVGLFETDRFGNGRAATPCRDDHSRGHLQADGFSSVSFQSDQPLDLDRFQALLNELPTNVFRAKGILWIEGRAERYVFHLTGNRFSLESSPWTGPPSNRLVLIGPDLDCVKLQGQLEACLSRRAADDSADR